MNLQKEYFNLSYILLALQYSQVAKLNLSFYVKGQTNFFSAFISTVAQNKTVIMKSAILEFGIDEIHNKSLYHIKITHTGDIYFVQIVFFYTYVSMIFVYGLFTLFTNFKVKQSILPYIINFSSQ
jgi:hypothetical protein